MDTNQTPLQLATAARVSCATLEEQIARGRHRKALATARLLWQRIDAMAARIEDQLAQIERLQMERLPLEIPAHVTDEDAEPVDAADVEEESVPAPLGARPPGFDRVRMKMRERRPNPCALVPDRVSKPIVTPLRGRKRTMNHIHEWRNESQRDMGSPHERITRAYLEGRLRDGQIVGFSDLKSLCDITNITGLQMDLSIHRAPLRLIEYGSAKYMIRAN